MKEISDLAKSVGWTECKISKPKQKIEVKEIIEDTLQNMLDFGEDGKNLLPVATQNAETGELLILASANKLALDVTLNLGYACYWSKSRDCLWLKGLTSGDLLKVTDVLVNCEQNSLLYKVLPQGVGACHSKDRDNLNRSNCYYRRLKKTYELEFI